MSDTKAGYVEAKERARSGKSWKLKLGGQWYSVSNRANLDGVEQGLYVEYRLGGFNGNDGKWITTVDAIRPAKAPDGAQQARNYNAAQNGSPVPSRLASAYWDDSALRFISNVVGCAVTAGHAKDPTDVLAWAAAAEQALKNLGQAQTPTGSGVSQGPAPRSESSSSSREPGSDDEPPPFDDSDVPW